MGRQYKKETREIDVLSNVLCDICGNSTRDKMDMNYEYAHITANWGYGSAKDGEVWDFFLCEKCVQLLPTQISGHR